MNWQAVTFDWNHARAFLVTAEEGTLSAAARALGMTQPTLGRQVAALEEALGVTLFDRVGRSLRLTETGRHLREHMRRMADAAADMSLTAAGRSQRIEGLVRLSATDLMAADVLPGIVARLRETAPGIEIEIVVSNALSDLRRREADIALRHTRPEEPELICRKVADERAYLYAATRWIERRGRPRTPEDLRHADFVTNERSDALLAFFKARGLPVGPRNIVVVCANGVALREMVARGVGVSYMTERMAEAVGGVERLLPDLPPFPVPLWLTAHRELMTSARVRLVFDILAEELSAAR